MANNTATGALSRTRGSPAGVWCSGTCCIWARSTIRQELAWRRSIEVLEDGAAPPRTLSLFPEDRCAAALADASTVHVKLSQLQLRRPRQWGACWLALTLWRELPLDQFWSKRLGSSRKGTRWDQVLFVLVAYRLLAAFRTGGRPIGGWRWNRHAQASVTPRTAPPAESDPAPTSRLGQKFQRSTEPTIGWPQRGSTPGEQNRSNFPTLGVIART